MARFYTYSFEDTDLTIQHPSYGSYSAYGTGLGDISISFTNDVTSHEVSADAAVVVSKSVKKNGSVGLNILQSSDFNTWLKGFANYLETAPASEFAQATMVVRNKSTGETFTCSGVSHSKKPDTQFQAQSQYKNWNMMCANIEMQ